MAIELARVRRLLRDRRISDAALSGPFLEELMSDAMDELAIEMGAGDIIQTGFATVSTTAVTIAIATPYPGMRSLKEFVRQSDGRPLTKTTMAEILWSRAYGGGNFGQPYKYNLSPAPDESVLLNVYPTPQTPEILTAVWEPIPSAVTIITGTIFLGPTGLRALRTRVAGRAILSLPPDKLAGMGASQGAGMDFLGQSKLAAAEEWQRMHMGELQDRVVRARR
jgi:hypothetical protein